MKLPKSRTENIVVQNLNDETLIYDLTTHKAFCLNETSAKVFNACDGETTFEELKNKFRFTDEIIYLSLDELKENNLIKTEYVSPFAGMSRREVVKKIGLTSLIALPMISSLVAPPAAHAQSGGGSCSTPPFAPGCSSGTTGITGQNCAASSPANKSFLCNLDTGGNCASGSAEYNGSCTDVGAGSVFGCRCV